MKSVVNIVLGLGLFLMGMPEVWGQRGVVVAGGGASGTGGSVSYSVGQVDHYWASGTGGVMILGVQQPKELLIITEAEAEVDVNPLVSVFPNPSADDVTVRVPADMAVKMRYVLCDAQGVLLIEQRLTGEETRIPMADLAQGMYVLSLYRSQELIQSFQLIQQH